MSSDQIVLTSNRALEVPVESTLLSTCFERFQSSRAPLLDLVGRAASFAPVLKELRDIAHRMPEQQYRVVFPPGALERIQSGSLELKGAKDGSGLLPTIYGEGNQFVKQVRLERADIASLDASALANAAAHAQTHALLRQVLVQLDELDKKLDLQLAYDRADWTGQIAAGVEQYRTVNREPGADTDRAALMANAVQSLTEGQRRGLFKLREYVDHRPKPVTTWWRQFFPVGSPKVRSPSVVHAETLDRIEQEFAWLYAAARTKAAIHADCDRPIAAANEIRQLAVEFAQIGNSSALLIRFARYDSHRDEFWRSRVRTLLDAPTLHNLPVALECTAEELLSAGAKGGKP